MNRTTLALAAALLAAQAAGAQDMRSEVGLQWAPSALAKDDRRTVAVTYDRSVGNGFALGMSLGYGDIHRYQSTDGVYFVVRGRWRLEQGLGTASWVQPQLGLEYGGTTNLFRTGELWTVFAGVRLAMSNELGFVVEGASGRARDKRGSPLGDDLTAKRSVANVRLALNLKY